MAFARLSSLVKRATQLTTTPFHSLAISPKPPHFTAQSNLTASFPPTSRQAVQTHLFSTTSEKRNIQDHKRRLLAAKYELRRKLYKSLSKDPELSTEMRAKHRYKLSKLPRNSAFVRVRNRCVFTGRARAVYQYFRMSRLVFRDSANKGALMGVTKASW